jgi:hypothetical protein
MVDGRLALGSIAHTSEIAWLAMAWLGDELLAGIHHQHSRMF